MSWYKKTTITTVTTPVDKNVPPEDYLVLMRRSLVALSDVPFAAGMPEDAMKEIDRLFTDFTFKNMQPGDIYTLRLDGWLSVVPNETTEVRLLSRELAEKFLSDLYQLFEERALGE